MQSRLPSTHYLLAFAAMMSACSPDRTLPTGPETTQPSFAIYTPGTVTVEPTSTANLFTDGWFGYGDRAAAVGAASIGAFPATLTLGNGSLRMTNSAFGWEVGAFGTPAVAPATPLSDITELAYSTFTPSGQSGITIQHVALQFTIDYDLNDAYEGFQGRLVYEPYHCNSPVQDVWLTWNTLAAGNGAGCWWQTANPSSPATPASLDRAPWVGDVRQTSALPCPQGNPCTWAEVLTAYPDAGFHRTNPAAGLILKIGSAWLGTFYTDALFVGVSGVTTTFDFEPEPTPPVVTNVTATPNPAGVGVSVALTADVSDVATGNTNITGAEYTLDGLNWLAMAAADGAFDEPTEAVTVGLTAPALAGVYDLCVRGTDATGSTSASECADLVVYDPTAGFVTGGGWIQSPSGSATQVTLSTVWDQGFEGDANGWFDGNSNWYGSVTRVPSGTSGVTSYSGGFHAEMMGDASSGPYSRFDAYRSSWNGTWVASVAVYLDPAWSAGSGFDYSVAATGSDGNHQRDFIFHIAKDISTDKLLVAGSNNTNFAVRQDLESVNHHEITTAGWYVLRHTFRDQAGSLAVDLQLLDANGSLLFTETRFTAADLIPAEVGGNRYAWFTVISGITLAVDAHQLKYPVLIDPVGKATFGFVSKYVKGKTVPTGQTEFTFTAASLNFHSAAYEWLVVNQAGANAQFKGSGTINGVAGYSFMLWAGDGDKDANALTLDTFRIKIWVTSTNQVVYDNQTDTVIAGGNIMIHIPKK